jgi:D-threo-aldose 1-dehydrogenase
LGLGGAPLGNLFTAVSDANAQAVVMRALDGGCKSFDTAPHYGNGLSETRMGAALATVERQRFALSSKVGRLITTAPDAPREQHGYVDLPPRVQHWDYSAAGVRQSVQESLQRLGLSRLDAVFVHDCCPATHGSAYGEVLDQVVNETLPELYRLKAQGLVTHIGLGVNEVQVCLDVLQRAELDCLLLAGRYTLLDTSALETLLSLCLQRGVRLALGGAFNSGILATGVGAGSPPARFNYAAAQACWVTKTAALEVICHAHGVPLRAAALQFAAAHPAVDVVLLGAQTVAQWDDGVQMMRHAIPHQFWYALRAQGLLPVDAPVPDRVAVTPPPATRAAPSDA